MNRKNALKTVNYVLIVCMSILALGLPYYLALFKLSEPVSISPTMAEQKMIRDFPKPRHLAREVQKKRIELIEILDETEQFLD